MARALDVRELPEAARIALGLNAHVRKGRGFAQIRLEPEHVIQTAYVSWTQEPATLREFPELDDLYAVPNFKQGGVTRAAQLWGAYFNEEGRKRGQLDLVIPHARGSYHHAYLETKAGKNRLTEHQRTRARALVRAGNYVAVCYSTEALKQATRWYLRLADRPPRPRTFLSHLTDTDADARICTYT